MKLRILRWVFLPLLAVLSSAEGQVVYLFNLDEPTANAIGIGSDRWLAQKFQTGTEDAYQLDSITFLAGGNSGSYTGFLMEVFTDNAGVPGTSLGSLSGSAPVSNAENTYTASGIELDGSAAYWIVLSTATPLSSGFPFWRFTNSFAFDAEGGWIIPSAKGFQSVNSGANWTQTNSVVGAYKFSVTATPVPEPGSVILLGSGLALVFAVRRMALRRV